MQILKDEVRNKIIEAAVEEFLLNGYAASSLRTIASQAGITIGNIYSYFSSKEVLFENVVSPAWEALNELMSMDFADYKSGDEKSLMYISNAICGVFVSYRECFIILLNGSGGTKFENIKENIIDFVSNRIKKEFYAGQTNAQMDALLAKAMASALLSGFLTIFYHFGGDEERLNRLIKDLLFALLNNMQKK
jgi:AcrR family transcriptional regulator